MMSVKTENNGVSVSRQCFSYKCHVSNIDFHKSPFPKAAVVLRTVVALELQYKIASNKTIV